MRNKHSKFPRRWPMFRLADTIISLIPAPKEKEGVVILRMFGIGDALLFRAVLEKYAEALNVDLGEITVLGSTTWAAVAACFDEVKLEMIDERRFAREFVYRLKTMLWIRRRGFKIAVCGMRLRYPHVIESLLLASGAARTIVASARPNEKFNAMFAHYAPLMTDVVIQREAEKPRMGEDTPLPLMHEITQQLAFLSAVAGREITLTSLPKLAMPVGPAPKISERYAVLAIGASFAPRRWPLYSFLDIAKRLAGLGWTVVVLGGPAEVDLIPDIRAFRNLENEHIIFSINELSFPQATQLIGHAGLVVSNDSGLGHLSIMLHKPSVLVLGGGHFGTFMPYPADLTPPHVRVLYHVMPCFHCNWHCTQMLPGGKTFPCVSNVSADQVWAAVNEVIAA